MSLVNNAEVKADLYLMLTPYNSFNPIFVFISSDNGWNCIFSLYVPFKI